MFGWFWKFCAVALLFASVAFSVPFTFTYSGRLLDSTTGQPISGSRSIKITFWNAQTGGSQLAANAQTGVTNDTYTVTLASGVFSQVINLSAANFHTVFPDSTTGTWVQVQDMTAGVTYPRQQFSTVPYALKIPVDGTTLSYNSSGALQVNALTSSNLPATINATNLTASGSLGVGTTTPGNFGTNAKFAVSNGSNYFYVSDDLYTSAMFGPRKANDGFSTVMYSWGTSTSGNYWQQDASSGALQWARNSLGVNGGNLMTLTSSGNLGIGTASPTERLKVVDDSANYTASMAVKYPPSNASTSFNYVGQWSESNTANSTGQLNNIYGSVNRVNVNTAGSTITGTTGSNADVYVTANRPVTGAIGLNSGVVNQGSGTISNAYSVVGSVANQSTGTITNGFGLYINQIQATNKFGVYSADSTAANVLMGNTGIGTASPAAKLDVAGEVKFGNTSSTCNATNEGQQRYNSTLKLMQFCNGTTWETVGARAVMPIIVTDEKAVNTVGGSVVADTWTTRTLNTIKADPGGYVSLASNQLTFSPGSYKCIISAPSYKAQYHQIRLYNVTNSSVHAIGTQDHSEDTDWTGNRVFLHTYFQISASTTFRVEHIVNLPSGGGTGSLGVASPWTTGTFTVVDCLRLGY